MILVWGSLFFLFLVTSKGDRIIRQVDLNKISDSEKLTVDFIRKYGFPGEIHEVETTDNYILTLHRIPHNGSNFNLERPVVLLQHGVILSSDQWVLRGKEDLAFLLSQQGYDVWMSNSRGTPYSRHRKYSTKDPKFWDYSLDELGNYDLRAIIDYVLKVSGKSQLSYIGHSRGVAMAVILLSNYPQYNSKINVFLALAPVIYSREARCPLYQFAGNRSGGVMNSKRLEKMLQRAHVKQILATNSNMRRFINQLCQPGTLTDNICPMLTFFINGEDFQMFNKSLFPIMLSHFTNGIGVKETIHFLQISESDIFRPFDYGKKKNFQVYGVAEPPPYNLKNVLVPTFAYYGPNDLFVSERDLYKFALQLPNFKGFYKVPYDKFNHVDYMFAKIANKVLYPNVIDVINEYNKKS